MFGSDGNRVIDAGADGESLIRFCGRQDSTCARPPIWILIGGLDAAYQSTVFVRLEFRVFGSVLVGSVPGGATING